MSATPAIDVRGLCFGYGDGPVVLDIPAWTVAPGERLLVSGPSGGGKSTLLGLLAGVLRPAPGTVSVLGTDLGCLSAAERDRFRGGQVGYIFQLFNLIPYLDVGDNIALPCRLSPARRERLDGRPLREAAREMAERLGIGALLDRPVSRLSVGQQQRVAAARALIGSPRLVLADEATSALDADHKDRFLDLLFERCAAVAATLIFVSHDPALATYFDRSVDLPGLNRVGHAEEGSGAPAGGFGDVDTA